jgi:hypothetical protein
MRESTVLTSKEKCLLFYRVAHMCCLECIWDGEEMEQVSRLFSVIMYALILAITSTSRIYPCYEYSILTVIIWGQEIAGNNDQSLTTSQTTALLSCLLSFLPLACCRAPSSSSSGSRRASSGPKQWIGT